MRVIAGSARHLPLKTIDGPETRPTTDRIKETIFNILNPELPGADFVDLFAGSGQMGIEALSRGAGHAYFVEKNPACVRCIQENLTFTKLADRADVMKTDVFAALGMLEAKGVVADVIFLDPPYNNNLENQVLDRLSDSSLAGEDTLIVIEASKDSEFDWVEDTAFTVTRVKEYKTNKHIFVRRK